MIYRTLGLVLSPLLPLWLRRRAANGKEDRARLHERFGFTEAPRPGGPLVWIHGASVGEVIAALPLVDQILMKKERHVLVTSGTVTSASILAERLPPRATHQYVPLDTPGATKIGRAHV